MPPPNNPFPSYQQPWEPRPLSGRPRPYAFYLAYQGQSRDQVYASLMSHFGPGSVAPNPIRAQEAGRLADFADNARQRFATFFGVSDDFKLVRSLIPRDAGQTDAYRFVVNVQFANGATGATEWRIVILDSDSNLTAGQVQQRARALAVDLYVTRDVSGVPGRVVEPVDAIDYDLVAVTRRS